MKALASFLLFTLSFNMAAAQSVTNESPTQDPLITLQRAQEEIDSSTFSTLEKPIIRAHLDPSEFTIHWEEVIEEGRREQSIFRAAPVLRSMASSSADDLVSEGWTWLQANQGEDGSWSKNGTTKERDTQAVIEFMNWIGDESSATWIGALNWYQLKISYNLDSLSRKIFNLAVGQGYTDDLSSYLVTQVNPNTGSFGYSKYHQQDTLTTALALKALTESGYFGEDGTDFTVYETLYELLVAQNADGGYGYSPSGESRLYPTEVALDALLAYDGLTLTAEGSSGPITIDIATILDAGFEYVNYQQNEDGSFGQNVAESALAYDLFLRRNSYPSDYEGALNYLLGAQNSDGSYNDSDPYSTAVAVKALAKPDLTFGDISLSTSIPDTPATLTIPITNQGYLNAEPFTLEIDLNGSPLFSYDIPYTLGNDATLNVGIEDSSGFPMGNYDFEFRVIPSDTVGELDPDNNSQEFSVHFSNYTGPTPPAWFGAATSSSSGRIRVSWLPSTDSDVSTYKIYVGSSSGTYTASTSSIASTTTSVSLSGLAVDTTFYFSIVGFDALGNRGDYSMESSAMAKTTPTTSAQIQGSVTGSGTSLSGASLTIHGYTDVFTTNSGGTFTTNVYPGHYYFTASYAGYDSLSQEVNAIAGSTVYPTFDLQEQDDGSGADPVSGLSATAGDQAIDLNWTSSSETHFAHYKIYRSNFPITDLGILTPLTTLSDLSANSYTDSTIRNGINYYYAVVTVDSFGNTSSIVSVGPVVGNSAPQLSGLSVNQEEGSVRISYHAADNENSQLQLSLEYWDGSNWVMANNVSGIGTQTVGNGKVMLWNAKLDYPDQNTTLAQVRLTASDGQSVNSSTTLTSSTFALDTQNPVITIDPLNSSTSEVTLTGSSSETLSSLELQVNGQVYAAEWSGLSFSATVTEALADGYYDVSASGTDLFANNSSTELNAALLVDTTAPVTTSFYASNGDGFVTGTVNSLWNFIHNATNGAAASYTTTTMNVRSGKDTTGKFAIERAFLPFNTAALPDDAEISSATLKVYVNTKTDRDNDGDDFITVVQTSQASTLALVTEDYDQAGALSNPTEGATRQDLTSITAGTYLSFILNSTGLGWISKTGATKLGLREGHDVINSAFTGPSNQSNSLQIRSANTTGTTSDPVLEVTYDIPVTHHYDVNGQLE